MAEVFISYKRNPSAVLANLIKERLEGHHTISAFLDVRDMGSGSFPDHLAREIDQSKALLCILSNSTLKSTWVMQEVQRAYEKEKILIKVTPNVKTTKRSK